MKGTFAVLLILGVGLATANAISIPGRQLLAGALDISSCPTYTEGSVRNAQGRHVVCGITRMKLSAGGDLEP